jgi:hypothetical protein
MQYSGVQEGSYYYLGHPTPGYAELIVGFAMRWWRMPDTFDFFSADLIVSSIDHHFLSFGPALMHMNLGFRVTYGGFIALAAGHTGDRFTDELARTDMPCVRDGLWNYFEFKVGPGHAEIRRDGIEIFNQSGLDTNRFGSGYANTYLGHIQGKGPTGGLFGGTGQFPNWQYDYDDVYIATTSGGIYTDFVGDVKASTLRPIGPGPRTEFVPWPAGSANWADVSDTTPDGDTTNVSTDVFNAGDVYQIEQLQSQGTILSVQFAVVARRYGTANGKLLPIVRQGTVEANGPAIDVNTTAFGAGASPGVYHLTTVALEVNPLTGVPWIPSDLVSTATVLNYEGYRVSR